MRLREALLDAPAAQRVVVQTNTDNPALALAENSVGVVTVPMSDTVKEVVDGKVRRTVPRETLVQVVGPWIFDREALADVLTRVAGRETEIIDMIALCETARVRVRPLPAR